jgi:hypothetical protein
MLVDTLRIYLSRVDTAQHNPDDIGAIRCFPATIGVKYSPESFEGVAEVRTSGGEDFFMSLKNRLIFADELDITEILWKIEDHSMSSRLVP